MADPPQPIRDAIRPPFGLDIVWLVLPASVITFGLALMPVRSWDYWWHITMGRLVAQTGDVVRGNTFLYTMEADAPSFVQPWLSQWLLYQLHDLTGPTGIIVLRTLLAGLVVAAITIACVRRAGNAMTGALVVSAALPFLFFCITERSHVFVWPMLVALLGLGYAVRAGSRSPRWLLLFPVSAAIWSNLHGTFIFPALVGIAFFAAETVDVWRADETLQERPSTRWSFLAAVVASLIATLANPRGFDVYTYMFSVAGNPEMATVTEWMPTLPWFPTGYGTLFYLLLCVAAGLMFRSREKLDAADLFLLAGFALIAMRQSRGLLWFGFVFPIVTARYLQTIKQSDDPPSSLMSKVNLGIAAVLVLGAFGSVPATDSHRAWLAENQFLPVRPAEPWAGQILPGTPVEVAELIRQDPLFGLRSNRPGPRIFNHHEYSGFLMFQLTEASARPLVFVDHRIELPPAEIWRAQADVSNGDLSSLDRFSVNWVIAHKEEQPELVNALREEEGSWELVHEDDLNVTYRRRVISVPSEPKDREPPEPSTTPR